MITARAAPKERLRLQLPVPVQNENYDNNGHFMNKVPSFNDHYRYHVYLLAMNLCFFEQNVHFIVTVALVLLTKFS